MASGAGAAPPKTTGLGVGPPAKGVAAGPLFASILEVDVQRAMSTLIFGLLLLALLIGAWLAGPGATLLPDPMIAP
jgi:hypothetical protein